MIGILLIAVVAALGISAIRKNALAAAENSRQTIVNAKVNSNPLGHKTDFFPTSQAVREASQSQTGPSIFNPMRNTAGGGTAGGYVSVPQTAPAPGGGGGGTGGSGGGLGRGGLVL